MTDLANALNDPNNKAGVIITTLAEKVALDGNETLSGDIDMGG